MDAQLPNAEAVYAILVEECAAPVRQYDDFGFARYWTTGDGWGHREWRFQGNQGFGGKIHWNRDGAYVTCYPEDDNPERKASRDRANARLRELNS